MSSIRLGNARPSVNSEKAKAASQNIGQTKIGISKIIGTQRRKGKPISTSGKTVGSGGEPFLTSRTMRTYAPSGSPENAVSSSGTSTEEIDTNADMISAPGPKYWGTDNLPVDLSGSNSAKHNPRVSGGVPVESANDSDATQTAEREFVSADTGTHSENSGTGSEKSESKELSSGTHSSLDSLVEQREQSTGPLQQQDTEQLADLTSLAQTPPRTLGASATSARRAQYHSSKRSAALQLRKKPLSTADSSSSDESNTSTHARRPAQLVLPELTEKRARTASNKPRPRLLSPRETINNARTAWAVEKAEKRNKRKLHSVRKNLPAGVSMDDQGNLAGTALMTRTPKICAPNHLFTLNKQLDKSYQEFFQDLAEISMGKTLQRAGFTLARASACADLGRHQFEFGSFSTKDVDPTLPEDTRIEMAARALVEFAGSEKAAFVLSSLLHQSSPSSMFLGLASADGTSLGSQLRLIPKLDIISNRDLAILNGDGSRRPLKVTENAGGVKRDIGGMTSCKFNLSRHGDQFKLSLDWETYCDRQRDKFGNLADGLPPGADDVIPVHFQCDLFIDEGMARDGAMKLTTEGIRATFSGRLDLSIN